MSRSCVRHFIGSGTSCCISQEFALQHCDQDCFRPMQSWNQASILWGWYVSKLLAVVAPSACMCPLLHAIIPATAAHDVIFVCQYTAIQWHSCNAVMSALHPASGRRPQGGSAQWHMQTALERALQAGCYLSTWLLQAKRQSLHQLHDAYCSL